MEPLLGMEAVAPDAADAVDPQLMPAPLAALLQRHGNHDIQAGMMAALRDGAGVNMWNQEDADDQGSDDDDDDIGDIDIRMHLMDPYHSCRMIITEEERNWALAIKEAVEGDPDLSNISDFLCAQLAIVEPNNMEAALNRIRQMQWFKEEYDIRDSLEDARKLVQEYLCLFENHILSFSYSYEHGSYICCIDCAACDKDALQTEKQWQTNLGGFFYMHNAMNPDLMSMRNGVIMVYECEGFTFSKMGGIKTANRITKDFVAFYPTKHQSLKFYHTGMFMNLLLAVSKPLLPQGVTARNEVGCIFQGRLDTFYLVPSAADAQQRNYIRVMDALSRRYANEASFRL
ncbi:expressed unknown protein [Seminavis robusta]|uniref:CRAL-TRIO domain-containing protein n=1 Tax=Seminavis robusta TaxID=568900 RepID=A0A9N8H454_9STRA|nr:expressed unknown protein [Seminavis robusta]|eukprot:Sro105_g053110.1 n/a (344) ;mRNA; r:19855-21005